MRPFCLWLLGACALLSRPSLSQADDLSRPIVIGQSFTLQSHILNDKRTINVHVPGGCAGPNVSCPVLYLLDGGIDEDFLHVVGTSQVLAENGNARDIIVVGIGGADRKHDLTSPTSVADDLKALPTSGGVSDYRRFLVSELKPWVAAHFRSSGRSALMGESLGGLFTLETLLKAPSDFDDYVVVSPSLWWDGGALAASAKERLAKLSGSSRLWLDFESIASPATPPSSFATDYRAQQDTLDVAVRSVTSRQLIAMVSRSTEPHKAIYPGAVFEALRALYPPQVKH